MKDWLRNKRSVDDVFKLLRLDDEVDNLLQSPLLSNWVIYLGKLDENPYTILLGKLKTFKLTATDDKLVDMLTKANQDVSTSVLADKLETAQLDNG